MGISEVYKSMNVFATDNMELGKYMGCVQSVRGADSGISDELLTRVLMIKPQTLQDIRLVINEHPDWMDEDAAEEAIGMETKDFYIRT